MLRNIFLLMSLLALFFNKSKQIQQAPKIIMAVFAHPDDETTVTPLLSKYKKQGHTVYLVIATKGEMGPSKREKISKGDSLAAAREKEANCVCKMLGIHPPILLGMGDGTLTKDFTGTPLHEKIDSIFKLYKPDVVITWGPDGGYGHMDHRMVHNSITEIFQSGKSIYPKQLYYVGWPMENFMKAEPAKTEAGKDLQYLWKPVKKQWLTTRIGCDKQDRNNALQAFQCHKTQFTEAEIEDVWKLVLQSNNDTIYLRPFIPQTKILYDLFK